MVPDRTAADLLTVFFQQKRLDGLGAFATLMPLLDLETVARVARLAFRGVSSLHFFHTRKDSEGSEG